MKQETTTAPPNSHLRLTLRDSVIHHFTNKTKQILAEGTCRIYETDTTDIDTPSTDKSYKFCVKTFSDEITQSKIFVRISYPSNTTYLFEKQNHTIYSISFNSKTAEEFQNLIGSFTSIINYNSSDVSDKLREKINQHCPPNIQTKDITNDFKAKVKKIGRIIGIIAGTAQNIVTKPAQIAAQSISQRSSKISRESISQNTHQKWNTIKQKSSQINDKLSYYMTPIVNKYKDFEDYIGENFRNSENKVIKTVREYSLAFSSSINDGQKTTHQQQDHVEIKDIQQTSNMELK